tara:strand:+ start:342 stop:884 length:543 start_codon:yes stop_codon:yes gene_type:complete
MKEGQIIGSAEILNSYRKCLPTLTKDALIKEVMNNVSDQKVEGTSKEIVEPKKNLYGEDELPTDCQRRLEIQLLKRFGDVSGEFMILLPASAEEEAKRQTEEEENERKETKKRKAAEEEAKRLENEGNKKRKRIQDAFDQRTTVAINESEGERRKRQRKSKRATKLARQIDNMRKELTIN